MKKKIVVVTGSKGRLGELVLKNIDKKKFEIHGYDKGDDPTKFMDMDIDYILHLAGTYSDDLKVCLCDNISLTNNFLRLAKDKNSKILVIGSKSVFYKMGNYQYSKAIVASLALEYLTMGVDVSYFSLPEIVYEKENIFKRIDKKRKKEEVVVDQLTFNYVKGEELAKEIATKYLENKNMNVNVQEVNLYEKFKRKKNTKKGIKKTHVVEDNYGIVLMYIQKMG